MTRQCREDETCGTRFVPVERLNQDNSQLKKLVGLTVSSLDAS